MKKIKAKKRFSNTIKTLCVADLEHLDPQDRSVLGHISGPLARASLQGGQQARV